MGVDLRKYKKEIVDAAWIANVEYVSTTGHALSGEDYWPILTLGVALKSDEDDTVRKFKEHIDKTIPDPIGVVASELGRVMDSRYLVVDGRKWALNDT